MHCTQKKIVVCILAVFLVFGAKAWSADAPLTEREKELLKSVEELRNRVNELEKKMSDGPAAPNAAPAAAPEPAENESPKDKAIREQAIEERISQLEQDKKENFKVYWKDGLSFDTLDGNFKLKVGGRLFVDAAWFSQSDELKNAFGPATTPGGLIPGDEQDGFQIRMGRINIQGDIYKDFFYRIEYELAGNNGPSGFTDTYLGIKNVPYLGTITIGHFKEPISLEELVSDTNITFMERALPNAFSPARNLGVMLNNAHFGEIKMERLTWALGVFKPTDNWPSANDSDEDQGYAFTGRITGLPWYKYKGKQLIHVGFAYSHREPDGAIINAYSVGANPESRLSNVRWVNTEGFGPFRLRDARAETVDLLCAELAGVYGPFSLQGEYMHSFVDTTFDGMHEFDGLYVQGSYFLTGEYRLYKNANGIFDRVRPNNNFQLGKGWKNLGAWEIAARYSNLNLDDGAVRGGVENNYTLGVNWYLSPNMRWTINGTLANIDHDLYDGHVGILQTRFQVDF